MFIVRKPNIKLSQKNLELNVFEQFGLKTREYVGGKFAKN